MRWMLRVLAYSVVVTGLACRDAAGPIPHSAPDETTKNPAVPFDPGTTKVELYTGEWFSDTPYPPQPVASMVVIGGQHVYLWAKVTDASGNLVPIRSASWSSSNADLVNVRGLQECPSKAGCYAALVSATGDGEATVTAQINGVSASVKVSSLLQPAVNDVASIQFTVLKLESGALAPQLRISVPAGTPDVDVIALTFTLPGLRPWRFCATRHVASGTASEMFGQFYGDYELEFDPYDMPAGDPQVMIYFRLANGSVVSSLVTGQVVAGGPGEYRGGTVENPWQFCGYGLRTGGGSIAGRR